jgi:hypothetical protein
MKFRKLRIAWSVGWGILAVLLIVLWVRSYWWEDYLHINRADWSFYIAAQRGELMLFFGPPVDKVSMWIDYGNQEVEHYYRNFDSLLMLGFWFGVEELFPGTYSIYLPLAFIVPVFSMLTIAPWINWRFTLRTLLIATTLVAVLLGLIGYAAR